MGVLPCPLPCPSSDLPFKVWEAFFTVLFSIELSLRWLADGFFEFFRTKECAQGEGDGAAQGESCNTRDGED